jgi:tetratricopeptide (TPR) repeat protein
MRARRGLVVTNWFRGRTEQSLIHGQLAGRSGRSDDVETVMTQAVAYGFGGLHERALPLYRRAIELDPLNAEAFLMLLGNLWDSNSKDAIQAGSEFLRLFGDYHETHNYLAFAHQLLGNYETAREHYEKAITHSPPGEPNFDSLVFAGILLDELGERERAEEVWRRGVEELKPRLEAYPDNFRTRSILACFYGLLGERAAFVAEETRALEVAGPVEVHYLMAVHARLGDTERAMELLASSVQPGRLLFRWQGFLQLAFAPPMESERFDEFVKEYEAEERRLRELY